MTNNEQNIIRIVPLLSFVGFLFFSHLPFFSVLGITLFIYFSFKFFFEIGTTIEIRDLMIVIALIQWVIGPILKYHYSPHDVFYYMAVSEKEYMDFVFPATLLFIIGLHLPVFSKLNNSQNQIYKIRYLLNKYPNIDLILISVGLILSFIKDFAPESIRFFIYLMSLMRYTGLFFLAINDRKNKWFIIGFVILLLFIEALRYAMFHELILWLIFLFIFIAYLYKLNNKQKLTYLLPLIVFVVLIQSIKFFFRQEIQTITNTFDKAEVFSEMIQKEILGEGNLSTDENIDAAIDRINQGWIVARIINYVPRYEPFANGETIITGIRAALIPRFLDPDKPKAGGRNYFTRFTGKLISEKTSMGLSPLGEAYANFGSSGGAVFMFLLGLFYNFYLFVLLRLSKKYYSLILWIPLLFIQVIKAETDFVVVLNHLVKASIVVAIIIFSFKKFLNIKL